MDRLLKYAGEQPVIRPRDLARLHIPRNYLGRLVRAGKLERVGNGLYSSSENPPTENRTLVEVCRKVPRPSSASRPRCASMNSRRESI